MQPSLRRELTLTSSTALVISNMIGTGIFTTTGFLAGDLGRPMLVLGIWAAGALVALAGCVAYAELGINLPRSGGEYVYLREAWGPTAGFLSGWVSFFAGFSAPIAAGVLAFADYTRQVFPNFFPAQANANRGIHVGAPQLLSIAIIGAFAVINIFGLRLAASSQNLLTAVKLGVLSAFIGLAFMCGHGDWAHFHQNAQRIAPHYSLAGQFAISLIFVMFAYSGWNAAAYVGEEMRTPQSTLPAALIFGTIIVALFYLALNVVFLYATPLQALTGVVPVGAVAAVALFGAGVGKLFSAMMAVALLSCVSAMSLAGPRVYYAMAQDGCFPSAAAHVHPDSHTPVRAIVFQAAASAALVLSGTYEALIYYIGILLILFAALAVAGLIRLRKRPNWRRLPAVSWCYPAIPLVFIVVSSWMLGWTLTLRKRESAIALLTLAVGGLVYRWKFRRDGVPASL